MAAWIFETRCKQDPRHLGTVQEIDRVFEKATGIHLRVQSLHEHFVPARGSVFKIKEMNANALIDQALKK